MGRAGLRKVGAAVAVAAAFAATAAAEDRAVELVTTGPAAGSDLTEFDGVALSDDGTTVAFSTTERLVSADEDAQRDVYLRRGGVTMIASQGEKNGNLGIDTAGLAVSQDGGRVLFVTAEQLVAEDADAKLDVYEFATGRTRLISARAPGAPGDDADVTLPARLPAPTADRVILETRERMLAADGDATGTDLYELGPGGLKLLTTPGDADVVPLDADRSLTHVFFETAGDLLASDTDGGQPDTYMTVGGELTHVSRAPSASSGGAGRIWADRVTADAARALLVTGESLVAGDSDGNATDVYLWHADGTITWISQPANASGPTCSRAACPANSYGASDDLGRIAVTTPERLLPGDTDDAIDVYAWTAAGGLELVSTGPGGGNGAADVNEAPSARQLKMSTDGRGVIFTTAESLLAEDTDAQTDLYERIDGTTRLVSTGEIGANGGSIPGGGIYRGGAARVFFGTATAFVRADGDENLDLYLRENGTTTLISIGRAAYDADYIASSADGARAFFRTRDTLAAEDTDGGRDLYVSRVLPAPGGPAAADTTPPEIALRLTRRTFRTASRKARVTRRTPLGTYIDAYVNEGGQANITFSRLVPGRRTSKGKCSATSRRVRKSLRCTRFLPVPGKLEIPVRGGRNRIRFYGRVGSRRLRAGRYAVFARAYDGAGNASKIASATFTVRSR